MSSTGKEWLFVVLFFVGFIAITVAEIIWLTRSKSVVPKRAALFVLIPNFVVITAGLFASFIVMAVAFAIVWDGTASKLSSPDLTIGAMVAVAVLVPVISMIVIRRLLFRLLKGEGAGLEVSPWIYSILSSIVFFVVVFAPPPLIFLF
jgi:hypothetical protein